MFVEKIMNELFNSIQLKITGVKNEKCENALMSL